MSVVGIGFDIRGLPEVNAALDKLAGPGMKSTLQKATMAGAKALKPYVQREAPGGLRKRVSVRSAKRDRPAAVVGHRKAFWWGFVVRGTKAHRIRFPDQKAAGVPKTQGNIQHPGARANPFVDRGYERGDQAAIRAIDQFIDAYLEKL